MESIAIESKSRKTHPVVHSAKRFSLFLYLLLSLGQGPRITYMASSFATSWWENRSSVLIFTAINAGLTASTEFVSRQLTSAARHGAKENQFFVHDSEGHWRIHHQSLINILMTCIASLLGGPVYFFKRPRNRWFFFMGFGVFNSVFAQTLLGLGRGVDYHRVLFDLCYSGTLKFLMFEIGRGTIVRLRHVKSVARVGVVRVTQDFVMSLIRVTLLNFLRFKG